MIALIVVLAIVALMCACGWYLAHRALKVITSCTPQEFAEVKLQLLCEDILRRSK